MCERLLARTRVLRRGLQKSSLPLEPGFMSASAAKVLQGDEFLGECEAVTGPRDCILLRRCYGY
jgi:hypothetical protein